MKKVIYRAIKVIYVFLLLFGLILTGIVWLGNTPSSHNTYTYKVTCQNGKIFDPTSKPIDQYFNGERWFGNALLDNIEVTFNQDQIKSECEYGTAYFIRPAHDLPLNYLLSVTPVKHIDISQEHQTNMTIGTFAVYYVILEIIRRAFLYIFFGTHPVTLKRHNEQK